MGLGIKNFSVDSRCRINTEQIPVEIYTIVHSVEIAHLSSETPCYHLDNLLTKCESGSYRGILSLKF